MALIDTRFGNRGTNTVPTAAEFAFQSSQAAMAAAIAIRKRNLKAGRAATILTSPMGVLGGGGGGSVATPKTLLGQ